MHITKGENAQNCDPTGVLLIPVFEELDRLIPLTGPGFRMVEANGNGAVTSLFQGGLIGRNRFRVVLFLHQQIANKQIAHR